MEVKSKLPIRTQIIKPALSTSRLFGQDRPLISNTSSVYPIPKKNNKWMHGLNIERGELTKVEEHFGYKFDNSPDSNQFWSEYQIDVNNDFTVVDIYNNPEELLKVRVLQEMGILSSNKEEAEAPMNAFKFSLTDVNQEREGKVKLKVKEYEIASKLQTIKEGTPKHYRNIALKLIPSTLTSLSSDEAFYHISEYIEGSYSSKNSTKYDRLFDIERILTIKKDELDVMVVVKKCLALNIIRKKAGVYTNTANQSASLGKSESEVIDYLLSDEHQDELGMGDNKDAPYSLKRQLSNQFNQ